MRKVLKKCAASLMAVMSLAISVPSISDNAHCDYNPETEYDISIYPCSSQYWGYSNTQRINSFNEGGLPPVALRTSTESAHHAA